MKSYIIDHASWLFKNCVASGENQIISKWNERVPHINIKVISEGEDVLVFELWDKTSDENILIEFYIERRENGFLIKDIM
jgi:hypothetical protein